MAVLARVHVVGHLSASFANAFESGDLVRRRQIDQAVCANPTARDKKALYLAKKPFSFFEGHGASRVWWAIVESVRTWIIERNFQIPPLYVDVDETTERRRRAGVLKRCTRRSTVTG
jgi:hypothetical protein